MSVRNDPLVLCSFFSLDSSKSIKYFLLQISFYWKAVEAKDDLFFDREGLLPFCL